MLHTARRPYPIAFAVLALISLAAPAAAQVQDMGGNVQAYADEVARLNRTRSVKRITGICASACTMFLGVERVCVEPEAQLWFHAARLPRSRDPDPLGSLQMLSYYPPPVRRWAIRVGALESTRWHDRVLNGQDLIEMGIRPCPGRPLLSGTDGRRGRRGVIGQDGN